MIFDEFTLKSQIRAVPDFPKPGVVFRDITPLFQSPRALRMTVDSFVQRYIEADFSHIGAMDARGFLIGSAVAYALNKPLVLFRKQGKLPADVLAEGYQTEYGEAFLEVHADSLCEGDSVLISTTSSPPAGPCWRPRAWYDASGPGSSRPRRSSTCRNSAAPLACRTPASPPSASPRSPSTSVDTPGRALAPRFAPCAPSSVWSSRPGHE